LFWICSEVSEVSSEFSSEFSCKVSSVTSTFSSESVTVESESSAADSKLSSSGLSFPKRCFANRSSFLLDWLPFSWSSEKNYYYFLSSLKQKFIIFVSSAAKNL
jgi:hypothetical protein